MHSNDGNCALLAIYLFTARRNTFWKEEVDSTLRSEMLSNRELHLSSLFVRCQLLFLDANCD